MSQKKIIIIGGGLAGLTAAAYLARAGLKVAIFEKHTQLGGYVSSFVRKGFIFPSGPTSFGSNGVVFPILEELGLCEKQKFVESGFQISWEKHDVALDNIDSVYERLLEFYPGEKRSLSHYFRWVKVGAIGFHESINNGMMFGKNIIKTIVKLIFHHPLLFWALQVANKQTNRSLHNHFIDNDDLRKKMNQLGYPVMSGKNTLGMWGTYFFDSWVPVGGFQEIANTLASFIQQNGGEIHVEEQVTRILVKDGKAYGIELKDGEIAHSDFVVSAADFRCTCLDLIGKEQLPKSLIHKLENVKPSESIFSVWLGLRNSAELSEKLKRFKNSHAYFTCSDGVEIQLALLSKDDSSIAPPGKHCLTIRRLSSYENWSTNQNEIENYKKLKNAYCEDLISRAEEFIPGIKTHIEVKESATPLTFERYTANWKGSTAGWNWNPKFLPHFDFEKDLPIKNFYPIGHYVYNPGGVPTAMITAWYIAREIIKKSKVGYLRTEL